MSATVEFSASQWLEINRLRQEVIYVKLGVHVALQSIQGFIVIYASSIFLEATQDQRRGRRRFIIISWGILAISLIYTVLDLLWIGRNHITGFPPMLMVLGDIAFALVVTTGDCLMVWRCFSLWKNREWVVILPALSTLGSSACSIVRIAFQVRSSFTFDYSPDLHKFNATFASLILSAATNIMATTLILFPLAQTWWFVSKALPGRKVSGMYLNVAAIIIESAAPLTACGIGVTITLALAWGTSDEPGIEPLLRGARFETVHSSFNRLYFFFSVGPPRLHLSCTANPPGIRVYQALSPQMIIFRVTMGRSWRNSDDSNGGAMAFSRPIDFARVDTEVEGRDSEPAGV
ncbi:hypothetical protein BKA70DRAFT_1238376 [Coprinopsis sp. MPI-PUGE-AT-0042]|nr:hypothetical protein BKA70DRAFT_1238376 [Coprinopsis sp. MPI-PUGE-AT-0042]